MSSRGINRGLEEVVGCAHTPNHRQHYCCSSTYASPRMAFHFQRLDINLLLSGKHPGLVQELHHLQPQSSIEDSTEGEIPPYWMYAENIIRQIPRI